MNGLEWKKERTHGTMIPYRNINGMEWIGGQWTISGPQTGSEHDSEFFAYP